MKTVDDMPTGLTIELHPLVRRVLAPNPSPFTFTGTLHEVTVQLPGGRDASVDGATAKSEWSRQ